MTDCGTHRNNCVQSAGTSTRCACVRWARDKPLIRYGFEVVCGTPWEVMVKFGDFYKKNMLFLLSTLFWRLIWNDSTFANVFFPTVPCCIPGHHEASHPGALISLTSFTGELSTLHTIRSISCISFASAPTQEEIHSLTHGRGEGFSAPTPSGLPFWSQVFLHDSTPTGEVVQVSLFFFFCWSFMLDVLVTQHITRDTTWCNQLGHVTGLTSFFWSDDTH